MWPAVSELVTDLVRHTGGPGVLRPAFDGDRGRVAVHDSRTEAPEVRGARLDGGYGRPLVRQLTTGLRRRRRSGVGRPWRGRAARAGGGSTYGASGAGGFAHGGGRRLPSVRRGSAPPGAAGRRGWWAGRPSEAAGEGQTAGAGSWSCSTMAISCSCSWRPPRKAAVATAQTRAAMETIRKPSE